MLASSGVTRASSSKSASDSSTLSRRAIAMRWMIAFVEPPRASTQTTALRKAARVQTSESLTSVQTISTIRRPLCAPITACRESAAGIDAAPGSVTPSASTALVIDAVPIVMQCPGERAMPFSISCQSSSVIALAQVRPVLPGVDPDPSVAPQCLRSIGPAGTKIDGGPSTRAPMSSPGVVLSQPPISTAPSIG